MSRDTDNHDKDDYETPAWVVNALLENHPLPFPIGKVLEPCAGSGAILRAFYAKYWNQRQEAFKFTAVEIRQEPCYDLQRWADKVHCADFLTWQPDEEYRLILTNPPYSIAQQIVEHALDIAHGAEVIMLLKLSFLATLERFPFWQKHPLSKLLVLRDRPSFIGGGSDNSEYAWMIWNSGPGQEIRTIYSPTRPGKRR